MKHLDVKYIVSREDGNDFTEEDADKFFDGFCEYVEANGWFFGGSHGIIGDEE